MEIQHYPAAQPKGIIIFWPGWLIDFKAPFYKIPINKIVENNYSLVLYNPPGHGDSPGIFNVSQSMTELSSFLKQHALNDLPLIGISHSGGCNCLLKFAINESNFRNIFLFSPVLDSRRSITCMYENNTYHELIKSFISKETNKATHLEILKDDRWLSFEYWKKMDYSNLLNYSITNQNGTFLKSISKILEETVFPGHTAWHELEQLQSRIKIFIPYQDNWYPRHELIDKLVLLNIDYTLLSKGSSHFLIDHWENNWDTILKTKSP